MRAAALLTTLLLAAPVCAADAVRNEAAGLRFTVPSSWTRVPATSDMRAAQFRLPAAAGDTEPAEMVLFHFGAGKGGSVKENLDRWYGQLRQPDGVPTEQAAVVTTRTIHGLKVTEVTAPGYYIGMNPGEPPKSGWRLLGAVVEGKNGPWFWKAVGPDATVSAAKPSFDKLLESLEAHD
jgi:hypothetical protein